jgi:hypothetical protein
MGGDEEITMMSRDAPPILPVARPETECNQNESDEGCGYRVGFLPTRFMGGLSCCHLLLRRQAEGSLGRRSPLQLQNREAAEPPLAQPIEMDWAGIPPQ